MLGLLSQGNKFVCMNPCVQVITLAAIFFHFSNKPPFLGIYKCRSHKLRHHVTCINEIVQAMEKKLIYKVGVGVDMIWISFKCQF